MGDISCVRQLAGDGANPSSRIRRPKAVFLATGARYQFDIPRRYFAAQPKTAVVKTYPIPMP
jgi:hypothetical protein